MIRPEPSPGAFWNRQRINPSEFFRSHVATFKGMRPATPTGYPHQTEDRIAYGTITSNKLSSEAFWKALDESKSADLDDLFNNSLNYSANNKAYVSRDVKCRSLGGIELGKGALSIDTYSNPGGKLRLRANFTQNGRLLRPNLTSSEAYALYAEQGDKGIAKANERLKAVAKIHLRIGLARPFDAVPDKCFLQVNGLYAK